jgi:hypothetical protein
MALGFQRALAVRAVRAPFVWYSGKSPQMRRSFSKHTSIAYRQVIEAMFGWNKTFQDEVADREFSERIPISF